ncbi:MAG: hypothetical protein AAF383_04535 [Cyanobacteria bacterium P01_A01_bin.83]
MSFIWLKVTTIENPIPILYGRVVILCQLLALFDIVIGIAKGFIIYCRNIFSSDREAYPKGNRAASSFQASR